MRDKLGANYRYCIVHHFPSETLYIAKPPAIHSKSCIVQTTQSHPSNKGSFRNSLPKSTYDTSTYTTASPPPEPCPLRYHYHYHSRNLINKQTRKQDPPTISTFHPISSMIYSPPYSAAQYTPGPITRTTPPAENLLSPSLVPF